MQLSALAADVQIGAHDVYLTAGTKLHDPDCQVPTRLASLAPEDAGGVRMKKSGARFVVVGCSRSGTQYAAELLKALGIRCGHEQVFDIWRFVGKEAPSDFFEPPYAHYEGDSSFLAVPFVTSLPAGTVVLHQLREPAAVARSHMGIRFFSDPLVPSIYLADNHHDYLAFIRTYCPAIFEEDDELARCMRFWTLWNRLAASAEGMADRGYMRYRVEEMDRGLLRRIVSLIGRERTDEELDAALAKVPRRTNHRQRDDSVGWETLPASAARDEMVEQALTFGYEVPVPAR
jgi:hypothetical protein